MPLVRPFTCRVVADAGIRTAPLTGVVDSPPGAVPWNTLYPAIGTAGFCGAGAVQASVALPLPASAPRPVGAFGVAAGETAFELAEYGPVPETFTPATANS